MPVGFSVNRSSPAEYRITSELLRADWQRPAGLEWTVVRRDGGCKVFDLAINHVSQALTLRSEIGDMLTRDGGDLTAVARDMQVKSAALIG